ncbi:MAG TPA: hypothetical protein VIJ75_12765 [Hanamia sp.]
MENSYMAYTKEINGVSFYFVKKYTTFPDYDDFPKILDSMGMHTDFYKACGIAEIYEENVVSDLMKELHIIPDRARIIHMNTVKTFTHSFLKNTQQAILKLRWASIH